MAPVSCRRSWGWWISPGQSRISLPERSQLFLREPKWVSAYRGFPIAEPVASWLYETGSLTARLRAACGPGLAVKVLRQRWDRPFAGESLALGLQHYRHALVREVMLHCDGHPLVFARSVIPPEALSGIQCRLAHLGERPLGELLFSYRKLSRLRLELARISVKDWRKACLPLTQAEGDVWGRRSLYGVARGQVLVCEFFLPAVLDLPDNRK